MKFGKYILAPVFPLRLARWLGTQTSGSPLIHNYCIALFCCGATTNLTCHLLLDIIKLSSNADCRNQREGGFRWI